MYKIVPTYKDGKWDTTEFKTREEFTKYLLMNKQKILINKDFTVINLLDLKII